MHERALGRADEVGPAVVDVLAEPRGRVVDLAVDREVDEVLELVLGQPAADEPELQRGLLAALGEVLFVEREPQLPVLEDEVLTGVMVARRVIPCRILPGVRLGPGSSGSYAAFLPGLPR